jgi:hypothetical protein
MVRYYQLAVKYANMQTTKRNKAKHTNEKRSGCTREYITLGYYNLKEGYQVSRQDSSPRSLVR